MSTFVLVDESQYWSIENFRYPRFSEANNGPWMNSIVESTTQMKWIPKWQKWSNELFLITLLTTKTPKELCTPSGCSCVTSQDKSHLRLRTKPYGWKVCIMCRKRWIGLSNVWWTILLSLWSLAADTGVELVYLIDNRHVTFYHITNDLRSLVKDLPVKCFIYPKIILILK